MGKIKILDRYIGKTIITNVFMVLLVLISLIYIFTLVDELSKINDSYTLKTALFYVLNKVPKQTYDFFPMAVLIGSLMGLGALANQSELIVMRAAGFSVRQIIKSAMLTGLLMMVGVSLLGEYVVPVTEKVALEIKNGDLAKNFSEDIKDGIWVKNGNELVHIKEILPDKSLQNIIVYTEDKNRLINQKHIQRAEFKNKQWHLYNVEKTDYRSFPLVQTTTKVEIVDSLFNLNLFKVLIVPPEILPIIELSQYVDYLNKNDLDSGNYELAFWQKILSPFSVLIMLILTIPFVFGSQRNNGAGQRIFIGSLVGLAYLMLVGIVAHLGFVYGVPAFISVFSPMALTAIIAIYFAKKVA